jgi:hypothetical protein
MGKIVRRVLDGYETLIEWSPSDPASVKAAEMIFRREVEGGYVTVVEDDGVHAGEPVRSLAVDAVRVIMTTPMGGGRAARSGQEGTKPDWCFGRDAVARRVTAARLFRVARAGARSAERAGLESAR